MLVINRGLRERVFIDGGIEVEVLEIRGNRVRLGFKAPPNIGILRSELAEREPGAAIALAAGQATAADSPEGEAA